MTMRRYYRFAGLEFLVEIPEKRMYHAEHRLTDFTVDAVSNPHRMIFEMVEQLPPEGALIVKQPAFSVHKIQGGHARYLGAGKPYICAEHRGKEHRILLCRSKYTETVGTKTVLECMEAEHLIARNDGFVFHCSYIDHGGKAILFTAPSGTGKSTQAELWNRYRGAEIINGDRAAVRLVDGKLIAEGIPFAGSSEYCKNRSLPIAAIVYLGQAPTTTIRKMRGYEAFSKIWEGVSVNTWDKEDVERVSKVVQCAAAELPVFHMPCTPDESAVMVLEEALRKQVSV